MESLLSCEFFRLFCLRRLFLLGAVAAAGLAAAGLAQAAIGCIVGLTLFTVKSFFLYEGGRALMTCHSKAIGRAIAGLSSLGRVLFLAVALALMSRLGRPALLAACGGLLLGQIHLHLGHMRRRKTARCSST